MRVEDWFIGAADSPFTAPTERRGNLHGRVYGHASIPDGEEITSSRIAGVADGRLVTVSGSKYELGEPLAAYELAYPNARALVLGQTIVPEIPVEATLPPMSATRRMRAWRF